MITIIPRTVEDRKFWDLYITAAGLSPLQLATEPGHDSNDFTEPGTETWFPIYLLHFQFFCWRKMASKNLSYYVKLPDPETV